VEAFAGSFDAYVAKLDRSGVLQWSTFLGGGAPDVIGVVAVDSSGNVYVGGLSYSTWGSPLRAYGGGMDDAFAAKLNSSGVLQWNTFLGGAGTDEGYSIAVDSTGNAYVGGFSTATWGTPVRAYGGGAVDSFAAKLNSSGVLQWNTFLGGASGDEGHAIAVDGSGNVYVGGYSSANWGTPVRAFSTGFDAYAAKLNSSGVLQWNTFLGSSSVDDAYSIAVDGSGNVYVSGYSVATWGTPVRAKSLSDDAFAAKLNSSGVLQWNTFLGGNSDDAGQAIAVDLSGNVYVGGESGATWGTPLLGFGGGSESFAAKLDSSGLLQWNAFFGGSGDESGKSLQVDASGNVYVAGNSNDTWGTPVSAFASGGDAFVVLFGEDTTPPTAAITYSASGPYTSGDTVTITATFSEAMADSPVPQISISGANTLAATDMLKFSTTVYTYDYTVGAGNGTATVSMSTGTDEATNVVTATPTSGADFTVNNTSTDEEASPAPPLAPHGGCRGSLCPGRGGTAPLVDAFTRSLLFTQSATISPLHAAADSPAVTILKNIRERLLARIEKRMATVTSPAARRILEGIRERMLKRIDERITKLGGGQ
jgi:hypothetical protein